MLRRISSGSVHGDSNKQQPTEEEGADPLKSFSGDSVKASLYTVTKLHSKLNNARVNLSRKLEQNLSEALPSSYPIFTKFEDCRLELVEDVSVFFIVIVFVFLKSCFSNKSLHLVILLCWTIFYSVGIKEVSYNIDSNCTPDLFEPIQYI
jgi:hypothetical protein